eukprot:10735249-Karenia_brevis.AAC.1
MPLRNGSYDERGDSGQDDNASRSEKYHSATLAKMKEEAAVKMTMLQDPKKYIQELPCEWWT